MAASESTPLTSAVTRLLTRPMVEEEALRFGIVQRRRKVDVFALVCVLTLGFQVGSTRTIEAFRLAHDCATESISATWSAVTRTFGSRGGVLDENLGLADVAAKHALGAMTCLGGDPVEPSASLRGGGHEPGPQLERGGGVAAEPGPQLERGGGVAAEPGELRGGLRRAIDDLMAYHSSDRMDTRQQDNTFVL
jgi:hypothetical protein